MIEVIPSLPAGTFEELTEKINRVRTLVQTFQIDVADGLFVQNRSWPMNQGDAEHFAKIVSGEDALPARDDMQFEVHFMAHQPELMIAHWVRAGVIRALFHPEAQHDFDALRAAAEGIELGVSLNIDTPLEIIELYKNSISVIQLMGIARIGIQGQPFDSRVLDRIREVKRRYPDVSIEIDGAVNAETAPLLVSAGATRLAPGSYVLNNQNPRAAIEFLKTLE